MRRVWIPEELAEQVDNLRRDCPLETWVALAISEKVTGSRFATTTIVPVEPALTGAEAHVDADEVWVAIVHSPMGDLYLLWRYTMPSGVAMCPVIASTEEGVARWEELFAAELNFMDGAPIEWRHFSAGTFDHWLRAPAVEDVE